MRGISLYVSTAVLRFIWSTSHMAGVLQDLIQDLMLRFACACVRVYVCEICSNKEITIALKLTTWTRPGPGRRRGRVAISSTEEERREEQDWHIDSAGGWVFQRDSSPSHKVLLSLDICLLIDMLGLQQPPH